MVRVRGLLRRHARRARPPADRRALRRRQDAGGSRADAVNGELRSITHIAMHPGWRHANGRATSSTTSRSCSSARPSRASRRSRSAARARSPRGSSAPAGRSRRARAAARRRSTAGGGLRQATLRQISDADCAEVYRHNRPGRASASTPPACAAPSTSTAREPLSSGCFGDSGGPLIVGHQRRAGPGRRRQLGRRQVRRRPFPVGVRRRQSLPRFIPTRPRPGRRPRTRP